MSLWLYALQLSFIGIGLLIGLLVMAFLLVVLTPFLWVLDKVML